MLPLQHGTLALGFPGSCVSTRRDLAGAELGVELMAELMAELDGECGGEGVGFARGHADGQAATASSSQR